MSLCKNEGQDFENTLNVKFFLPSHDLFLDFFIIIFSDFPGVCYFFLIYCMFLFLAKSVFKAGTFGQLKDLTYGPVGLCQMRITVN